MGNLVTHSQSFNWIDVILNRNSHINCLNDVLLDASIFGDNIFYSCDLYESPIYENSFLFDLHNTDFDGFKIKYTWINQSEYDILIRMPNYFRDSGFSLDSLDVINSQYNNENNSWFGFFFPTDEFLIWNTTQWKLFHYDFIRRFNRTQRLDNSEYFNKFYQPKLNKTVAEINREIKKNIYDPLFKRLDNPPLNIDGLIVHNQNIHMHFKDNGKSALNIDGTWKHGGFALTNDVAVTLISLGFILPENL